MSNIEIVKSQYPTSCETYGCSNITDRLIGKPGENLGTYRVVCDECLQEIINSAPLEMIMNRPGLQEFWDIQALKSDVAEQEELEIEDNKPIKLSPIVKGLENVGKALEGEENLSELKYQQLKEIATEKGIVVPFGTSKDDLIDMLEGN